MQGKQKRSRAYKRFARERLSRPPPESAVKRAPVNWFAHVRRLLGMYLVHLFLGGN